MDTGLTHQRLLEVIDYSPETGLFTWKVHKKSAKPGELAGSKNCNYIKICIDYKVYFAHRLAWFYVHKRWPLLIDHKDRDGTNNRISNLRECSYSENSHNVGLTQRNSTGFKGVSYRSERGKYHAQLCLNGKRIHVGYFDSAESAHEAYVKKAKDFGVWLSD